MIKIRLKKTGRKHINTFRIVVIDIKQRRDSNCYLEDLGYYHPAHKEYLSINIEKCNTWIKQGAQMTDRVKKLYKIAELKQEYVQK
ncbi:30S ribosomal protein S16 [bacterium AB1]|nr:30S ribosomal protein S16 [bacterium AB1]